MGFDPTAGAMLEFPAEGHLNTFYGYRAEIISRRLQSSKPQARLVLEHIMELCGGNQDYFEYFLDLLSFPIQTGEKCEVAILQRGPQGCGKGAFYKDFLANKVYGKALAVELAGGKQIGGNFNSLLANRCLIIIDEPNNFSASNRNLLKNSITSDDMEVKAKYKDEKISEDFSNFVFTCNDVPEDLLEHDDRRFFCVEHSGKYVGDKNYFNALFEAIENEATAVEFFEMLKTREISRFAKGEHPPQTKIKDRILVATIDPVFRFLRHMVDNNLIPEPITPAVTNNFKPKEARKMERVTFYSKCLKFCEDRGFKPSWKGKSLTLLETIIKDKFEKYFEDGFSMFKQARLDGKSTPCVIFPEPDVLWEWLAEAKVLQTEDELEAELEKQESVDSQNSTEGFSMG